MFSDHLNQAIILFYGYLAIIALFFGWLPSISQSFYELKKHRLGFVFTIFMFSLSMLIILAAAKPIMTAAGLLIVLVGAFPYFDKKGPGTKHNQKTAHYLVALGGMLLGMVSLWVEFGQWEVVVISICIAIVLKLIKINNLFYWLELLAMNAIFVGMKLSIIK